MKYLDILKQHTKITKVEIEPTKHAKDFWDRLARDVYSAVGNHFLLDAMRRFKYLDGLEIVNKQGRLLRRFGAYYKREAKQALADSEAGIIGDKLQYFMSRTGIHYIDFTDNIDWQDGQFGKEESCWWSCYVDSISTFEAAGGWAIRFYNDENPDYDNGIGRTWVLPQDDALVCFNSYGIERPVVSKVIKKVFADHGVELHYQTAEIKNVKNETIPYINDGSGFVLSEDENHSSVIDLSMPLVKMHTCGVCEKIIRKGEIVISFRDKHYCENCYEVYCTPCDVCGVPDNKHFIHPLDGKNTCEDCLKKAGAHRCEKCYNYSKSAVQCHEGDWVCEKCNTFKCKKCHTIYAYRNSCPCERMSEVYRQVIPLFARTVESRNFVGLTRRRRAIFSHTFMPRLRVFLSGGRWCLYDNENFMGRYATRNEAFRFAALLAERSVGVSESELGLHFYYTLRRLERDYRW